jgi:CRP-like cAMP-binding protein
MADEVVIAPVGPMRAFPDPGSAILIEVPDLAAALRGPRRAAAERDCLAPVDRVRKGSWEPGPVVDRAALGVLVLDGMLLRRAVVGGRGGAELLGRGDVIAPSPVQERGGRLPRSVSWQVLRPARIAVLGREFVDCVTAYPEVLSELIARMLRRSRHAAVSIAIIRHPRVVNRLRMLLWDLADRWGIEHEAGVLVPIRLTHCVLADLLAAQRPSVTQALGQLIEQGEVVLTDGGWLLAGPPPVV